MQGRVIKREQYREAYTPAGSSCQGAPVPPRGGTGQTLTPSVLHPLQEELLQACKSVGHGMILVEVADGLPQVRTMVKYLEKPKRIIG